MIHDNFDDIFDLLDSDRLEALYDSYVEKYQDTPDPVTPELDAAMQKKFDELRKQEQRQQRRRKLSKIAATLIITLGIGGFAVTQTEAWKVAITQLRITFSDSDEQAPSADLSDIPDGTPFPITPEGYNVAAVVVNDTITEIIYSNRRAEITFIARTGADEEPPAGDGTADINGSVGTVIKHDDSYAVVWSTNTFSFEVSGNADINVLLTVAQSVK